MATTSERIKILRKSKDLSQEEFGQLFGIVKSTVSSYERGNSSPDDEIKKEICKYFDVSMDYLVGTSDIPKPSTDLSGIKGLYPITRKRFPLVGEIACGAPKFADEDHETYVEASADIKADFCLTAKGDSMIGARIQDGDVVFIREMPMVNNGEIAAVIIDNEATLKRVYYYPDKAKLVLNPENPAYEPLVYIGEELNQIRILGKAVCFMSNL